MICGTGWVSFNSRGVKGELEIVSAATAFGERGKSKKAFPPSSSLGKLLECAVGEPADILKRKLVSVKKLGISKKNLGDVLPGVGFECGRSFKTRWEEGLKKRRCARSCSKTLKAARRRSSAIRGKPNRPGKRWMHVLRARIASSKRLKEGHSRSGLF